MTILDQIIADTRDVVARRKRERSMGALEDTPLFDRTIRPFEERLRGPELAFIAEAKKASPSKGVIREDYDPADIGRQYEEAGASAMSVLTEPLYFQGSLDHLAAVREAVDLPLLRKDFVIDPYQIFEARAYGADAVLLIAAVLDRGHLSELHSAADELGLACLVEVYEAKELDKLDFDQVRILGVNNRDLRTFEVDIDHSLRVFAEAPEGLVCVSESGVRTAQDLAHLHAHGIDAVLIGETFMREKRPGDMLMRLREEMERVASVD